MKVALLQITKIFGDGHYETEGIVYEGNKIKAKKVINYCLKHKLPFKVGFKGTKLLRELDYIEITSDWFTEFENLEARYDKHKATSNLQLWLHRIASNTRGVRL